MNKHIFSNTKTALACALLLVLTNPLVYLPSAQAQQSQRKDSLVEKIKRFFFATRPGGVSTNRERGGAVRGRCRNLSQETAQQIFALVPSNDKGVPFIEQTISQRPTFWFYVPNLPVSQLYAELALLDNEGKEIYSQIFPLKKEKLGIIGLQLSSTISPLQLNKEYRWVFNIICNPENRAADAVVNGRLERVSLNPALNNQLKAASPEERVSIYTDKQLWYETLTNLAELQRLNPKNAEIKSAWVNVLQLMDLPKDAPQTWTIYTLSPQTENSHNN